MAALLTLSEQNTIKAISPNWANAVKITGGVKNFDQLQKEVENGKYKKLIGSAFLLDIQTNPTATDNVALLNGSTFSDCHNQKVKFEGIKYQLAFMNYAKYVGISDQADTFTGMVRQNRTETSPLSEGAVKREQRDAEEIAQSDFDLMVQFIIKNSSKYPLFHCNNKQSVFVPKLTTIRKTYR